MAQPSPAAEYGEMQDLDVGISDIKTLLSEALPRLFGGQEAEPGLGEAAPMEPTPLVDARLKAVKTQLSRFPGQEVPEEEMI